MCLPRHLPATAAYARHRDEMPEVCGLANFLDDPNSLLECHATPEGNRLVSILAILPTPRVSRLLEVIAIKQDEKIWLGGRDSNPDRQIQNLQSYRWTTSQ